MKAKLTSRSVAGLKPKATPFEVHDKEILGLSIRVLPSGSKTWYLRYRVDGARRRLKLGRAESMTVAQAKSKAREALADVIDGGDPAEAKRRGREHTLGTFLDEYEIWFRANRRSADTTIVRLRAAFGGLMHRKLSDINPWLIAKWRNSYLRDGKRTHAAANRTIECLRAALARAVEWRYLDTNPLSGVKLTREDSNARVRYLEAEEEKRLMGALDARQERARQDRDNANVWRRERGYPELPDLRAVEYTDHLTPLVLVALHTGCRRGELFDLRWADVNLRQGGMLTVQGRTAKTGQTRHIPLNGIALSVLKAWKGQSGDASAEAYVFPGRGGARLNNVRKAWTGLLAEAKVKGFRFHDLRHTFASKLVMAGVDLNTVRDLLGHSDLKMTQRYAHLSPEHRREAVERLVSNNVVAFPGAKAEHGKR